MPAADPGNAQPEAWTGRAVSTAVLDELASTARATAEAVRTQSFTRNLPLITRNLPLAPRGAGETCAPTIGAEMSDWISLGGSNLGCVGDSNHGTGFHRGANFVPATDYSRKRDPNGADGPFVNWNYACAGDFRHGGDATLRDLGRVVLAELMAGNWTNIGEFIGQPWADRPVMYWNRWTGVLSEYTGTGHDVWFHISWYRSRVDQNTHIWKSAAAIKDGVLDMTPEEIHAAVWTGKTWGNPLKVVDGAQEATYPITFLRYLGSQAGIANAAAAAIKPQIDAMRTALLAAVQALAAKDMVDEKALADELAQGVATILAPLLTDHVGDGGAPLSQAQLTAAVKEALRQAFSGGTA